LKILIITAILMSCLFGQNKYNRRFYTPADALSKSSPGWTVPDFDDPPIITGPMDSSLSIIPPYVSSVDFKYNNITSRTQYYDGSKDITGHFESTPAIQIPISYGYNLPIIHDFTGDGKPEVIGRYMNYKYLNPYDTVNTVTDKYRATGNQMTGISDFEDTKFDSVPRFVYPTWCTSPKGPYDFDGDGLQEVIMWYYSAKLDESDHWITNFDSIYVFEQRTSTSYPDSLMFKQALVEGLTDFVGPMYNMYDVGDIDGDGKEEVWVQYGYGQVGPPPDNKNSIYIYEYDDATNQFEKLWELPVINIPNAKNPYPSEIVAFEAADFDLDGKIELIIATYRGMCIVVEGVADNTYEVKWHGFLGQQGQFIQSQFGGHFLLNDINGDSRPELLMTWIHFFEAGSGESALDNTVVQMADNDSLYIINRFYVESVNNYWPVIPVGTADFNNDGRLDMIYDPYTTENQILVVGYNPGSQKFELLFSVEAYGTDEAFSNLDRKIDQINFYDVNNDGYNDLLLSSTCEFTASSIKTMFHYTNVYYSTAGKVDSVTSIENPKIADDFKLLQNYPNPFNPTTVIPFRLDQAGSVSIKVYDTLGRHVVTLVDNVRFAPGEYKIQWDSRNSQQKKVGSGVYYYKLVSGERTEARKMLLLK
jgi:hypothetical protein